MSTLKILGIETSCDETAAAVVIDGKEILSSIVASQIDIHHRYGGVVPELASRKHMEAIVPVVEEALEQAGAGLTDIDGIAVTQGPGLIGSLLVGLSFAKSLAFSLNIPWIGVDHLEGHINSVFLTPDPPETPFIALLASGGHTAVYYVSSRTDMALMGRTRDDAAGEAFDKVSKMLGMGYPGGGVISRLAENGDPERIHFPRALHDKPNFDFSFSGLKTAVKRYIQTHPDETGEPGVYHIAAAFQEAVADALIDKLIAAALTANCRRIVVAGGVAANRRLRDKLALAAESNRLSLHIPPVDLCGDNAAMIAAIGTKYLQIGRRSGIDTDVYSRSTGISIWRGETE